MSAEAILFGVLIGLAYLWGVREGRREERRWRKGGEP